MTATDFVFTGIFTAAGLSTVYKTKNLFTSLARGLPIRTLG
jgi:hypothetical protein